MGFLEWNDILLNDDEELVEFVNYQRRPYVVRCRVDHFYKWDSVDFKIRFRLSKETVMEVLELIQESIISNTDR